MSDQAAEPSADAELEAIRTAYEALKDLNKAAQIRIFQWLDARCHADHASEEGST